MSLKNNPKIRHEGFWANRLTRDNPREKAFARQWSKVNEDGAAGPIIAYLVARCTSPVGPLYRSAEELAPYCQQTASIAATVAQWLDSNIGFAFLREALNGCGYEIVTAAELRTLRIEVQRQKGKLCESGQST